MMIAEATITNAVYSVKRVCISIYATSPIHKRPKMAKRTITDVFISQFYANAKILFFCRISKLGGCLSPDRRITGVLR